MKRLVPANEPRAAAPQIGDRLPLRAAGRPVREPRLSRQAPPHAQLLGYAMLRPGFLVATTNRQAKLAALLTPARPAASCRRSSSHSAAPIVSKPRPGHGT